MLQAGKRLCKQLATVFMAVSGPLAWANPPAEPHVHCAIESSAQELTLSLPPTHDALDWHMAELGNGHRVYGQWLHRLGKLKLQVYDDSKDRWVQRHALDLPTAGLACQTGLLKQTVVTGRYEREVNVQCTLRCNTPLAVQDPAPTPWIDTLNANSAPPLRIALVGDVMLDELPGKAAARGQDPFAAFAGVLAKADLRVANLESAVGDIRNPRLRKHRDQKPYTFMAHPRVLPVVRKHFDVVSLANNHSGDFGEVGMVEALNQLQTAGVRQVGAGMNLRQAHQPAMFTLKGQRVALLAYNLFLPRSFEALPDRPGVAWGDEDYMVQAVKQARTVHKADWVLVVPHWGWEYEPMASKAQQRLARVLVQAGADAVIGGHPHVTQNIELIQGKPVFYSLGNFVFNGFTTPATTTGWLLELELQKGQQAKWTIHEAKMNQQGLPQYNGVVNIQYTESQ